jgi:hypothetical protein
VTPDEWIQALKLARSEDEVLTLAREYLASFDGYELRFLPARCQPRALLCANDVSTYAFDLVIHRCDEMDATARLVRTLAGFFTFASIRLSELVFGAQESAADRRARTRA